MSRNPRAAELTFVPMLLEHVPQIGVMDRRNYEFAWSDAIFRDCLRVGYICPLVMLEEEIIGYGVLQIGADEAHILNLCIDRPWRKRGFAQLLLDHLVSESTARRAHVMFLEVRPSNERAVELYQRNGFNEIGLRKDYYDAPNGREDALVMARNLLSPDEAVQ